MKNMLERLEKVRDEIEELEEAEMSWNNLEKLSILYNVEHHMCKKMGMMFEDGEYSGSEIGFKSGSQGSRGNVQELREMANRMNKQQLTDMVVGYGRELRQNGNGSSYMRLYNRMRGYSDGESQR